MIDDDDDLYFSENMPRRTGYLDVREHLRPKPTPNDDCVFCFTRTPNGDFSFLISTIAKVEEYEIQGEA